jgi:hypothetical protein
MSLYDEHPELRDEWDGEKNGPMKDYTSKCGTDVSWKCSKVNHHVWHAAIDKRTRKTKIKKMGCPYCLNRKICPVDQCNSLYYNCNDKLKKEWDETKNGSMKDYLPNGRTRVGWICSKDNHHKWDSVLCSRTSGLSDGCPICKNKLVCPADQCNSLYFHCNDKLKLEWDETKNGSMKDYLPLSNYTVGWKCSKDTHHVWDASIPNRNRKKKPQGCPICSNRMICSVDQCNSLYYKCNDIIKKEWDESKNGSMKTYMTTSNKMVGWICGKDNHHKWDAPVSRRTGVNESGCPICSNNIVCPVDQCNSLYYNCSDKLKEEWDEIKNGSMKDYLPGSDKKVSWICSKVEHHKWTAQLYTRTSKNGLNCPICSNQQICTFDYCNTVYNSTDKIKKEWNEKKNGSMKDYTIGSTCIVWWICELDNHHGWPAMISNRTRDNTGCLICLNRMICPVDFCNSFYKTASVALKKEWDTKRNGDMKNYLGGCTKIVWWICKKNRSHRWPTSIAKRTGKDPTGCPKCSYKNFSKQCIQWLELIEKQYNIHIKHAVNGDEYKVYHNDGVYKVDGYYEDKNIIFEYHGDLWHRNPNVYDRDEVNPVNGKKCGDLYDATIERETRIRGLGYNLIIMWEQDFKNLLKDNDKLREYLINIPYILQ